MIDYLRTTLHSFANNYQAIMWRLRECSLNDEQLGTALGVSGNAIRNRRAKPDLWKLSDVERLATHFALPVTACIQLNQALHELPGHLRTTPNDQRRKTERLLLIKTNQLELYNQSEWPVRQLLRMHRALTNGSH
ncbi:hypothetical protein [Spirosoma arcticum]